MADADAVHLVNSYTGERYRIDRAADGSAAAVTTLDTGEPLLGPDGLERVGPDRLLVVEQFDGALTELTLVEDRAERTVVANGLDVPTTTAIDGRSALVVEGQLDHLFGTDPAPPALPFRAVRVPVAAR